MIRGNGSNDGEHRWSGTSETRVVDGKVVLKSDAFKPYLVWMVVAVLGLLLLGIGFRTSWWLHLAGALVALVATVGSHAYRWYSHWFAVVVILAVAGTLVLHLAGRTP